MSSENTNLESLWGRNEILSTTKSWLQSDRAPKLIALISLTYGFFWLGSALPAVMGDELIYFKSAVFGEPSNSPFGNYIYSAVVGSLSHLGPSPYLVAKLINLACFTVFLFATRTIANAVLKPVVAWWVVAATAASALQFYVTVFMPDIMFATFMMVALAVGAVESNKNKSRALIAVGLSGLVFGLGSLVKPHALLFLPAFLLVWFIGFKTESRLSAQVRLAAGLVGAISARLLGFLAFGVNTLNLFPGYLQSPTNQDEFSYVPFFLDTMTAATSQEPVPIAYLNALSSQMILFLTVGVASLGVLILTPILGITRQISSAEKHGSTWKPSLVLSAVVLNGIAVSLLFASYVTIKGDDHTERLLFRYWEFAYPILLIITFAYISSRNFKKWHGIAAGLLAIFAVAGHFLSDLPANFSVKAPDSTLIISATLTNLSWIAISSLLVLAVRSLIAVPYKILQITAIIVTAGLSLGGLMFIQQLASRDEDQITGFAAANYIASLSQRDSERIAVVSSRKVSAGIAAFADSTAPVDTLIQPAGVPVLEASLPAQYDTFLFLWDVVLPPVFDELEFIARGQGFAAYKRVESSIVDFGDPRALDGWAKPSGNFVSSSDYIMWPEGVANIEFSPALISGETLVLNLVLPVGIPDREVNLKIGEETMVLPFASPAQTFKILVPPGERVDRILLQSSTLKLNSNYQNPGVMGLIIESIERCSDSCR